MGLNSKENVTSNLLWRLLERFGAQGVTFVVSIVLARLLGPNVYGVIAIVTVFTSIMQVFIDSGLANALIQKKEADDIDFSTVFYFNIVFCLVLYVLMFVASPIIADFYKMPDLVSILRVLSITIIVSGIKNVQQAYVSRKMIFKKFFFSTLGGTVGASVIGIYMAYRGYGVWALVIQNLLNTTVDTCVLWITVKWRPKRYFSFGRLKSLFSYGWKLLVSKLIDTTYEDVRSLIVGKMYSANDLAFYNRGKQFPQLMVSNINTAIESVLFPSMSMEQDDLAKVRAMTSRAVKTTSYIIMPMMFGLAVCSESIVSIILTDKWLEAVPYMKIFCFSLAIIPVSLANLNAIKAVGRSDIYLNLEIIRKIINTVSLVVFMWFGVKAIAVSYLVNCIMNLVINSYPNKKILKYGYIDQVRDILPSILLSALMYGIVYSIGFIQITKWVLLPIQVIAGFIIYMSGSLLFRVDSFYYIRGIIKEFINKNKAMK